MPYEPPVYPTTIPTDGNLPDRVDDVDWLYAARYNELKKELRACLTELGTLPKGAHADVKARLVAIEALIGPGASPTYVSVNITDETVGYKIDGASVLRNPGTLNVFIGANAGHVNASYTVAIGESAGVNNQTTNNFFLGWNAGFNSGGQKNVYIGMSAGAHLAGDYNVAIGNNAGFKGGGSANVFIGFRTGYCNNDAATGWGNVGVGVQALQNITNGNDNIGFGYACAQLITTGTENVIIGGFAAQNITTASYNIFIGEKSGFTNPGDLNIFIGYKSGYYETGSEKLLIDNRQRANEAEARTNAIIYGIMAAAPADQDLTFNANIFLTQIKSGATQGAAGAAANEIWKTNGHASLPDNVLMIGV